MATLSDGQARNLIHLLRGSLATPYARLTHCRDRIGPHPLLKRDRPTFSRGVGISTKLLGCDFQTAKVLLTSQPSMVGFDEAFSKITPECPEASVGLVYRVECPDFPGVIKVGFTSNLDRRLAQLTREYKVELRVIETEVGTYADEYVAHRRLGHLWLVNEWFGHPDNPRFCPDFIRNARGVPALELRERYGRACGFADGWTSNHGPFRTMSEAEANFGAEA